MTNDLKEYNDRRKIKKNKKEKNKKEKHKIKHKINKKNNNKNKKKNIDLYEFEDGQAVNVEQNNNIKKIENKKKFVKKNKVKIRKENIKENKKNIDKTELEDDIAIKMTNKNKIRQEEIKRKKMTKKNKKKNIIKRILKKILIMLTFLGIIIGSIIFLITSPVFNISLITVTGNTTISESSIIDLSGFELDTNMFIISKLKAEYLILQNPYIQNVNINRNFPDEIEIWVEERTPEFVIISNNELVYIDVNTYVLEKNCDNSLGLITITGIHTEDEEVIEGNQLSAEDINIFNEVYEILDIAEEYDILNKITSIDITDKDEYYFNMENDGIDVYLGDNTNIGTKIMYVLAIMEENIGNSGTIFVNGDFNDNFRAYFRKDV